MLGRLFTSTFIIILLMNPLSANEILNNNSSLACIGQDSSISQLQGQGHRSPYVTKSANNSYRSKQSFTVQGVVTKIQHGRNAGLFIQQVGKTALSLASRGIFVTTRQKDSQLNYTQLNYAQINYAQLKYIQVNTVICVTGFVKEYYGMTQLQPTAKITILGHAAAVMPTDMLIATADANFSETLERYEGMRVRLVNMTDMRVTKPLYYDRRWRRYNAILSHKQINIHPNSGAFPGSILADQHALENKQRRLYLQLADEGTQELAGEGRQARALASLRVNDKVTGIVGIVQFSYGEFRLIVDQLASKLQLVNLNSPQHLANSNNLKHLANFNNQKQLVNLNSQKQLAARDRNHLRIASFNVLNYFNSAAGGLNNPLRHNRGATTIDALHKQETKLVDTIVALDTDFIGLMEVENNGFGKTSAVQRLLALVNERINNPLGRYRIVIPDKADLHQGRYLGSGAITVAGFYRPAKLKLINTHVINLPMQRSILGNAYHRPALTPTFIRVGRQTEKQISISVNHFKSKGSKCFADKKRVTMLKRLKTKSSKDSDSMNRWRKVQLKAKQDRQGSCAQFRTLAAYVLAQALTKQAGDKIILGDLNSYPKEDPLLVLTDYKPERYAYYKITGSAYSYLEKQLVEPNISEGFGYHDPFNQDNHNNWTYSFQALGRLDYILLSAGLLPDLITSKVWHVNANVNAALSSSDHDPLFIDLK